MTIDEFVQQTLRQIASGISQGNQQMTDTGAFVVTKNLATIDETKFNTTTDKDGDQRLVAMVNFDLPIRDYSSYGNSYIAVLHFGETTDPELFGKQKENAIRVKFTVPLALPKANANE